MKIDTSVYPDRDSVPTVLKTDQEKADYVARICAAWDFGILPDRETFAVLAGWREVFEKFPIRDSPAYHAFCHRFGWPSGAGRILRAGYEVLDAREGRSDPCSGLI